MTAERLLSGYRSLLGRAHACERGELRADDGVLGAGYTLQQEETAAGAGAAKYVPLEQLDISPQCGFASSHHGNPVTPDDQKKKLELVLDVAREVWGGV
jgi:hypothetical protein